MTTTDKNLIKATTARKATGWVAVLEFPNGGRQLFSSRHGTMAEAQREANHCLAVRLKYADGCIPDPQPNQRHDLAEIGQKIEDYMISKYPTLL